MKSNSDMATEVLAEIEERSKQIEALENLSRDQLDGIKGLVVGRRVFKYGHNYEIIQASVGAHGHINCYGARVRNGKTGTRGYFIGRLSQCKPYRP